MVINNNFSNRISNPSLIQPVKQQSNNGNVRVASEVQTFESVLQQAVGKNTGVKFSKHAEMRMQARNINLTQMQKAKIDSAINKAEQKGVKDSLVILDNMAFVVNVNSKTVITAVNNSELKDNVFSNIDGAVFA